MIKVTVFGSGSSGNCYLVDDGKSQLMIEAGVAYKKVQQAMNFNFRKIAGLLISHEHGDHSKYIHKFWKLTSIEMYATKGTFKALDVKGGRYCAVTPMRPRTVGSWTVTAFRVQHDAAEPVGFLLENYLGERLLYVTDTYFVKYRFSNINKMLVEMNYSRDIAMKNEQNGDLNHSLENRLFTSHFEMNDALDFIKTNISSCLEDVTLIHLSDLNSNEELFKRKVQELTGVPVYVAPKVGVRA
ncbi:MBL fold metallo-hydrolase [Lactiplantibacillus mudanjiangensis]|uniref:MBL fold metallo-hydrolase [Lactobacillus plantarum] n=1 Tax=Lactiplantibacillus mudanjiangensis TaxID=1296538 RepID=A0A660DX94_9LACO|nr:MBL fold metallo-hydrolase [Lactiplantibacillus mudanjiangensis]VDG23696.1 MBL fold metallo-hydrolase [Lactobacillus plantarum] [Lactiplantibacillus mudanjiangensis]VDG27839.1 MBL fold metallo-hydrolase [Lactobacillus plantarum] [Lactiplantibacillus mudanjiangensis]